MPGQIFSLIYGVIYRLVNLVAFLPFRTLNQLSYLLYILIYRVIGYRKEVVRLNLSRSFPEKDLDELRETERKFYRYFSLMFLETFKTLRLSSEQMKSRVEFVNPELLHDEFRKGKSVMWMTAHYCNWEWLFFTLLHCPDQVKGYTVYQQFSGKLFDRLMLDIRSRYGCIPIEKGLLTEHMKLEYQDNDKNADSESDKLKGVNAFTEKTCSYYAMIADQSPPFDRIRRRVKFLNQDTPVYMGTEKLATLYGHSVLYFDMERTGLAKYKVTIIPISLHPGEEAQGYITDRYMELLEQTIRRKPEYWLWTHRRWKYAQY